MDWEVACPDRPSRVPGIAMAGFRDRGGASLGHRLVPRPAVTVVLDFGTGPAVVDDAAGRQHRGSLAGLGGTRVRGARIACVQVRLSPVVAGAVLHTSPGDLAGGVVALADLWGAEATRIGARLREAASWPERFALVDAVLAERFAAGRPADPEVAWAWRQIVRHRGVVRIDRLAAELGWSRGRLWSRFQAQVGLAPKRAATLVRFDHAAHLLVTGHNPARVAAECGYTDQSHMHREVMACTGVTPATLAARPFRQVDDIAWAQRRSPA